LFTLTVVGKPRYVACSGMIERHRWRRRRQDGTPDLPERREYPNDPWEKDNYHIRDGYREMVKDMLSEFKSNDRRSETC
jgi:hypothetical protein